MEPAWHGGRPFTGRELAVFAGLDAAELDAILSEARSAAMPKNSAVFEEGEDAHSFFVLLHGHVRASKTTPAGQQVVVRYVTPGEIFGVAKAIGLTKYPATATAVDDSVVLAWPSAAWPRLVAQHPALAANTLQTVGSRLQETHTRVVEMSTQQVERRVAHALLRLAKQAGRKVDDGRRDRFSDQPAGHRRNDRHHAAYGEPDLERMGAARG